VSKQLVDKTFTSKLYDAANPISIVDRTLQANYFSRMQTAVEDRPVPYFFPTDSVFKATVVRAQAFRDGSLPSPVVTRTYFVTPDGRSRFTLPVVSVSVQEDHLFDFERGIYVPGKLFDDQNLSVFIDNPPANYNQRGEAWERPATIELFEPESAQANFQQDVGIRLHGGWSRSFPMKSIRLYARGAYGNNQFAYPMFPGEPLREYSRLILRNGGNDWDGTLLRDPLLQRMVGHMNLETMAYKPVVMLLNGEYWGVHGLRERYDVHYFSERYGVNPDEIDHLTLNSKVVNGSADHYLETLGYIRQNGLESQAGYNYIQTRIDIENFIDYQIAQIFTGNLDWPGNNIDFWRKRTDQYEPLAPPMHDGRWRWIVFDLDFAFHRYQSGCVEDAKDICGPVDHNTLAMATGDLIWFNNPTWSTELFRALLANQQFRNAFVNRYLDQLNTAFQPERTVGLVEDMAGAIDPEMEEHFNRWLVPRNDLNYDIWVQRINDQLKDFAARRPDYARMHIKEFFGFDQEFRLILDVNDDSAGHIQVNTIPIHPAYPGVKSEPYPWTGLYFEGIPVTLKPMPQDGYSFSYWTVNGEQTDVENLTLSLTDDTTITAHFQAVSTAPKALVHYFLFQNLPNDIPLKSIASVYSDDIAGSPSLFFSSSLAGYPFDAAHPSWRTASMERRNQPTPLNYRPEGNGGISYEQAGSIRALQVRQPFRTDGLENTLILHLPTTGFDDPVLTFAAKDEDAGAYGLYIDYAVDFETRSTIDGRVDTVHTWTDAGLVSTDRYKSLLNNTYQLFSVDFSEIEQAAQNPHFRVRIRFDVQDASLANGDRVTFNNIALDAVPVSAPVLATDLPEAFSLGQNYPNPFNPLTTIPFTLTESAPVRLEVYNTIGQRVAVLRNEVLPAGWHEVRFDATGLSSGVYVYRLESAGQVQTRKLLLIR